MWFWGMIIGGLIGFVHAGTAVGAAVGALWGFGVVTVMFLVLAMIALFNQ